jgi:hypothetical protein
MRDAVIAAIIFNAEAAENRRGPQRTAENWGQGT